MFPVFAGAILSSIIVSFALYHGKAEVSSFANPEGLIVVFGGTLAVLITTSNLGEIKKFAMLFKRLLFKTSSQRKLKEKLLETAKMIEKGLVPKPTGIVFLDRALDWYTAGVKGEQLERLLLDGAKIEIELIYHSTQLFSNLSKYPPALGMVGTVIGIIGIFGGLGTADGQRTIGAHLAVAMSATLYGLILANFVISPISELLQQAAQLEEVELNMIVDTILMLSDRESSFFIQEKIGLYDAA